MAKSKGLAGWHSMRKDDLVKALLRAAKQRARIRASEHDTSVSALVSEFLSSIEGKEPRKSLRETIEEIRESNPNFSAADRLNRDELHDRDALR